MPWAARLLAMACVSLAAKMDEYRAPALSEFRADGDYEFCCDSIRRMELFVLCTLPYAEDRKSTRLNSSHITRSRMPSSA